MSEHPDKDPISKMEGDSEEVLLESTHEFADNLEEKSFDHLYEDLKLEILKKHTKEDAGDSYYCKVCGTEKVTRNKVPRCLNCSIPVCYKCQSCGFCLNCFVHLSDDARKTLKLMRSLTWAVPTVSIFLIFRGWVDFLFIELFLISLFTGLYFYTRHRIKKFPQKYMDHKWQYLVKSAEYQVFLDTASKLRFIPEDWKKNVNLKRQAKINKLKDWIDPKTDFSDVPIPAHYQEGGSEEVSAEDLTAEEIVHDENSPALSYKLINKACPNCGEVIIFGDFCPTCNLRFCPECHAENNPYSLQCVCGLKFPVLETEYEAWRIEKGME